MISYHKVHMDRNINRTEYIVLDDVHCTFVVIGIDDITGKVSACSGAFLKYYSHESKENQIRYMVDPNNSASWSTYAERYLQPSTKEEFLLVAGVL